MVEKSNLLSPLKSSLPLISGNDLVHLRPHIEVSQVDLVEQPNNLLGKIFLWMSACRPLFQAELGLQCQESEDISLKKMPTHKGK